MHSTFTQTSLTKNQAELLKNIATAIATLATLKEKKQAALTCLEVAITQTNTLEELTSLALIVHTHPDLAFIKLKRNPSFFKGFYTKSTLKISNKILEKMCELLIKQFDEKLCAPQAKLFFQTAHDLLQLLLPTIQQDGKNKQRAELLLQLSRTLITDETFIAVLNTFNAHTFKLLPLGMLLQNLESIYSEVPLSNVTPLYFLLTAIANYKLLNPQEDISPEAKYSGLRLIIHCIKHTDNLIELDAILNFLKQEGFNFLRAHKHPYLAQIQSAITDKEKFTTSWEVILRAAKQQANHFTPNATLDQPGLLANKLGN